MGREWTDGCQMEGSLGSWGKRGKGFRSRNWQSQKSHRDVTYGTGSTVSNIVITVYDFTRVLDSLRESLRKSHKCLTIMLYTYNFVCKLQLLQNFKNK